MHALDATFFQPFLSYTLPASATLALKTESTYGWSRRRWTVPINATTGQFVSVLGQNVQPGAGVRYDTEEPVGGAGRGYI